MASYTAAQQAAIACLDEPLQIIACAGSGKTQVISQRIAAILAQPGVEPRNVIAFTFTEKAAAELKERILSIVERELGDVTGLAEMYVGTMHGYALDLLQRLVPEKFKFSVLTDITAQLFVDRYSAKSGLTSCPTTRKPGRAEALSELEALPAGPQRAARGQDRRRLVPGGVDRVVREVHDPAIDEHSLFDYTQIIRSAVDYLEGTRTRTTTMCASRTTSRTTSTTSSLTSTRTSTRCRSGSCAASCGSARTSAWSATTIRRSTSGAAARCRTSSRSPTATTTSGRSPSTTTSARAEASSSSVAPSPSASLPENGCRRAMVAAGHQTWERGDLLALTFDDPEAGGGVDLSTASSTSRGVAFRDGPTREPRGLSWSDCAVLFRSVAKDSGPLVEELRRRGIPFIVKGLNRLFDSPEIQAVVGIFRFVVREIDAGAAADSVGAAPS